MKLDLPPNVRLYGDAAYRGKCPLEHIEQSSIINRIRREYPDSWGLLVLHPRNEGLVSKGQFSAVIKHKAEGMAKGASDVVIPGSPSFVCEIKRCDHTLSSWQEGQIEFLGAAAQTGSFSCVALGALAAWEAFEVWVDTQTY